jgi:hypothetical protein
MRNACTAHRTPCVPALNKIHEPPAGGATIDAGLTEEPLAKADRLQITNAQQEAPAEAASRSIEPIASDAPNSISPQETIIVNRHWHDPFDTNSATAKQFRRTVPSKKGKPTADPRGSQATDRIKPPAQTKALQSDRRW